jgi:hypothetical protein
MSVKFDFSSLETGYEALWPVKASVPQDGGGFQEQTFVARLRHVTVDEINNAMTAAQADGTFGITTVPSLYFVGLGPDEKATWSPQLRDKMLSIRWVREALDRAYKNFASGGAEKN